MELIKEFPITIYGNLETYNKTISKARCRIFYKGANRNGTFITDAFAEKLLSTIPYTPVKGIYDASDVDYTDHGQKRTEGRIYGVVPENPNFAWEKNLDEDGVEREYACVDVFLYTALYEEAKSITGKSQSMELYEKSIIGDWKIIQGQKYFVFEDAAFLGLQVLGEEVEPCFEGAAFFSLYQSLKEFVSNLENCFTKKEKEGGSQVHKINFAISDSQKYEMLWALLNPNYNEAGNWTVDYSICEIYEEYAVVRDLAEQSFKRIYYKKNDETDSLEITGSEICFIIDVTENEKVALDTLRQSNGATFEKVDELFNEKEALTEQISTHQQKVEELNISISTLTTERDEIQATLTALNEEKNTLTSEYSSAQARIETLEAEVNALTEFKKNVEKIEKETVLSKYSELLPEDVIETFSEKIDSYSAIDLEKELAYETMIKNPSVFSKEKKDLYVPKDNTPKSGLEAILSKYEK